MPNERFSGDEADSSRAILDALKKAEDAFREWQDVCQTIDDLYNVDGSRADLNDMGWQDADLDLFWSSFEVLKPAVYARPPQPVVAPLFKDGKQVHNLTAELLERCAISTFQRTDINDVMLQLRDDLLFTGRGAPWVRYDHEDGEHSICVEHKDRMDFLHEPSRKWSEVGWVAGAAWLTRKDMKKRFGDKAEGASYGIARTDDDRDLEKRASAHKAKVWEVWHKADNKVYWVTEGVEVLLDSAAPELTLTGFFPCPKPAYATLRRRSLIPVPDWQRYSTHFKKISELTRRIYSLLDKVRMKGLIPAGGDIGQAVEELIRDDSDEILIPVPSAAMMSQGSGFVAWLPLNDLAAAIQGLIEARTQLINDFYQLSGISDIMRGATDADETLGAQQLKSQFGSVRVREKSMELQRVAADTVKIAAEIIADKFPAQTLLDMSGLQIPKQAEIAKRVKSIEAEARKELETLGEKLEQQAQEQQEQIDPQQAQQALQQQQQQIMARYAPMLKEAEAQVPLEDVMKLLRDDRTLSFVFEIESSSTILTDELQEKSSRNEFLTQFTSASAGLMSMAAMGEQGAKLSGALLKFVLAPYRAGRELDGAIDEFIDAAPAMAAAAAGKEGDDQGLAEANKVLAQAEMTKAQASVATAQAKAELGQAQMQAKMAEIQQKAQDAQNNQAAEAQRLELQIAEMQNRVQQDAERQQADIDLITAQTAKILHSIGLDVRKQELEEYTADSDAALRQTDQMLEAQRTEADHAHRARGEDRADRAQDYTEQSTENADG